MRFSISLTQGEMMLRRFIVLSFDEKPFMKLYTGFARRLFSFCNTVALLKVETAPSRDGSQVAIGCYSSSTVYASVISSPSCFITASSFSLILTFSSGSI